jgi:ribosomal protein L40E
MRLKCRFCAADIPDESRFCLKCGKDVSLLPSQTPGLDQDEDSSMFAMMCMAFAFMMFFFSLAPFFLGVWVAGVGMLAVGVVLMLAGYRMIRVSKKDRLERMERQAIKIKCRYCGSLNEQAATRCKSCGASL